MMAPTPQPLVDLENVRDGEVVYQRAIILIGKCINSGSEEDFLAVTIQDLSKNDLFPIQTWPISEGNFKSLVILSAGENTINLQHYHNGVALSSTSLTLNYVPLLDTPPLHLAIMIAKDSPLLIDCPPTKRGAISSAHSGLDAAIKKFRMTAYMWQAMTAEDMRSKGLGRRSFRLEEEWTTETLSQQFSQASSGSSAVRMRSTAKIHLVRSGKTVAELRDTNNAQQNHRGRNRDAMHEYFTSALKAHGMPFDSSAHPIVAGLILDSTFCPDQDMILAHAALGFSNISGLSLGIFGSHLTYSWPRFLEEVPAALLDTTVPGDTVGNDNNECGTTWEACAIGQGAFLHELGHAFGAPHTTGIMARGYAQDWPKNFLSRTGYCVAKDAIGLTKVDRETENNATWDVADALSFRMYPHFRLPTDQHLHKEARAAEPSVAVVVEEGAEDFLRLVISSPCEIARVRFNGAPEQEPTVRSSLPKKQYIMEQLEARFDRTQPLHLEVLGMNGKARIIGNVWRLFSNVSFFRIPGSSPLLQKKGIRSKRLEARTENDGDRKQIWEWAVMLKEKSTDGKLHRATQIDSRVGCILDGAVVYFEDGHKAPMGPRHDPMGNEHHFGGDASEIFEIAKDVDITKVEIGSRHDEFDGLRFHMSDGTHGGYLHDGHTVNTLEPAEDEKIVGFYGCSDYGRGYQGIQEFGIITAPKDVQLPDVVYDLVELKNTNGGITRNECTRDDESEESGTDNKDNEDEC